MCDSLPQIPYWQRKAGVETVNTDTGDLLDGFIRTVVGPWGKVLKSMVSSRVFMQSAGQSHRKDGRKDTG